MLKLYRNILNRAGLIHLKTDSQFLHGYIRTPLGGFFNHNNTPNCEAIYENDFIIASKCDIVVKSLK